MTQQKLNPLDEITSNSLCIDDFGNSVYECRYTKNLVWANDCDFVGAVVPGVKAKYIIAPTDVAREAHRQSIREFQDAEQNCNTCGNLERVTHAKNKAGFLFGRCKSPNSKDSESPYNSFKKGDVMMFHPEDFMGMPCYSSRHKTD
jgi:hypothetical protein